MSEPAAAQGGDTYFLSYSRSDEVFALRFANDVRAAGVAMWVDQLDIRPSEHWDRAIEEAVRNCRGIVVILSPRSVASNNVADEISFAIDSGKSVFPVMIERCTVPLRITRMQLIDATTNYHQALQKCVTELRRSEGPAAAGQPDSSGRVPASLDPQTLASAKLQLAPILGPIAGVLIAKAATRATSAQELYRMLSLHIEQETERERFLAALTGSPGPERPPQPTSLERSQAIPGHQLKALSAILTRYIGPIAPVLAKRESAGCRSLDELKQILAGSIPREGERAQFLRDVQREFGTQTD